MLHLVAFECVFPTSGGRQNRAPSAGAFNNILLGEFFNHLGGITEEGKPAGYLLKMPLGEEFPFFLHRF